MVLVEKRFQVDDQAEDHRGVLSASRGALTMEGLAAPDQDLRKSMHRWKCLGSFEGLREPH